MLSKQIAVLDIGFQDGRDEMLMTVYKRSIVAALSPQT